MKHSWIIITLCSLLIIAGACLMLMPRTVPIDQCSDVYRQYQGREGLEVSFVKQYRVNDTTAVDVTLIHATTDSAWSYLCMHFLPQTLSEKYKELVIHGNTVNYSIVSKTDPHTIVNPLKSKDFDFLVITNRLNSICIFHTKTMEQVQSLITHESIQLSKNNTPKQ